MLCQVPERYFEIVFYHL